jgi:hypothetical protein
MFGHRVTDLIDEVGHWVGLGENVKPWTIREAFVTSPAFDDFPDVPSAELLPDVLVAGLDLLVSERLMHTLKENRLDPEIGFLPTRVRRRNSTLLATYHLLYSRVSHNVLDITRSRATLLGEGAVDTVDKWVLNRALLPEWDLFYAHEAEWITSDRIHRLVTTRRFRGLKFRRLSCVRSDEEWKGRRLVRLDE